MLFSIIIPVYNGERTLRRCLSSIAKQTLRDYQVLVVNDGSTDGTLTAAEEFARQDDRFSVLSKDNSGAGAARNMGLKHAQGEYVLFLDADDYWVQEDLLEILQSRIAEHPTDVLMFQMHKVTEKGDILKRYTKPGFQHNDAVHALRDVYLELVADGHTLASAGNKCVRRQLLTENSILFRENTLCEDIDWVLQLFSCTATIRLMNLWAYAYTQHHTPSRSTQADAPRDLVGIVEDWSRRIRQENMPHREAVAGLTAFEYGICMGSYHLLQREQKAVMRKNIHLLQHGLDRKTRLIHRFCRVFGFSLTCMAIRVYLLLRRIW